MKQLFKIIFFLLFFSCSSAENRKDKKETLANIAVIVTEGFSQVHPTVLNAFPYEEQELKKQNFIREKTEIILKEGTILSKEEVETLLILSVNSLGQIPITDFAYNKTEISRTIFNKLLSLK